MAERAMGKRSWKKVMSRMREEATRKRAEAATVSHSHSSDASSSVPIIPVWTTLSDTSVSWAEDATHSLTMPTIPATAFPGQRDWSVLRSNSAHPWRALRHRKRRLFPRHGWEHIPLPDLIPPDQPLESVASILVEVTPTPIPSEPTLPPVYAAAPVETVYGSGVVESSLARICTTEIPQLWSTIRGVSDIAWPVVQQPDGSWIFDPDKREDLVLKLRPDALVFLGTILCMMELEPPLAEFFTEPIAHYIHAWVEHCTCYG
jgi:hypothetical protein